MFKCEYFVIILLIDFVLNEDTIGNRNLTCEEYTTDDYNNNNVNKTLCIEAFRAHISINNAVRHCANKSMKLLDFKDTSRTTLALKMVKRLTDHYFIRIPLNARRTKTMDPNEQRATALKVNRVYKISPPDIKYISMNKSQELPALCKTSDYSNSSKSTKYCKGKVINSMCYYIQETKQTLSKIRNECELLNAMPFNELLISGLFQTPRTFWIGENLYTWDWNNEDEAFSNSPVWEEGYMENETTECLYVKFYLKSAEINWRAIGCNDSDYDETKTIVCYQETITKMSSDPLIKTPPSSTTFIKPLIILAVVLSMLILAVGLAVLIYKKKFKHRRTNENMAITERNSGYAFVLPFKSKKIFIKTPQVEALNYVDLNLPNHENNTENTYSIINDDENGRVCVYSTVDHVQMNDHSQLVSKNSDMSKKSNNIGKTKKKFKNLKISNNTKERTNAPSNSDQGPLSPAHQFEKLAPTSPMTFCTNDLYNITNGVKTSDDKVVLLNDTVVYGNINYDNKTDTKQHKNSTKPEVKTVNCREKPDNSPTPVPCSDNFVNFYNNVYYKMSSPTKTSPSEIIYESASPPLCNNNNQGQHIYDNNSPQHYQQQLINNNIQQQFNQNTQPQQLAYNNQQSIDMESPSKVYCLEKPLI